jgi:H+-translocating NAD(P) transhydrogenase subunit alpha
LITGTSSGGVQLTLGLVAVVLATANMVGGFVVTDRMLEMFKGRGKAAKAASKATAATTTAAANQDDAAGTRAAGAATDRPAS